MGRRVESSGVEWNGTDNRLSLIVLEEEDGSASWEDEDDMDCLHSSCY